MESQLHLSWKIEQGKVRENANDEFLRAGLQFAWHEEMLSYSFDPVCSRLVYSNFFFFFAARFIVFNMSNFILGPFKMLLY